MISTSNTTELSHAPTAESADAAAPGPQEPPHAGHLAYSPGLDGLRGLALLAIVAFHAQLDGVPGAFLSVSTFFTLSGFLITSVALAEHRRTGRVGIGGFYARRARRLLPAALVAIVAITILTVVLGDATQAAQTRGDAFAALFYVENWRLVFTGESYGAIFESPSTFTHFWTLGIEEQFYLAFPLTLALVLAVARGSRAVLAAVLALLIVASTAWSAYLLASGASIDRLYFGTDTRLAEILVGCLVAVGWSRVGELRAAHQRALRWLGAGALVLMLASWLWADRTTTDFYRGGLLLYSVVTVLVILAAVQPTGPVRAVLGWRPLVLVGVVSYAAYLVHWPILVWLQLRTPYPPWARLAIGLAATLVLAALSLRFLERPVRSGRWPARRLAPSLAVGACAIAGVMILGVTASVPATDPSIDFESAAERLDQLGSAGGGAPEDLSPKEREDLERWVATQDAIAASTAPRMAWFGDSTAVMNGLGVSYWAIDNLDQLAPASGSVTLGCGLLSGINRQVDGQEKPVAAECDGWLDRWRDATQLAEIDIAVVQFGPWEMHGQQLEPGQPFLVIGENPELDEELLARLDEAVTVLLEGADTVVLVASPDVVFGRVAGNDPPRMSAASDPRRMERYRQLVEEVASRHDRVAVARLDQFVSGRDDDAELRPDGVHFTEAAAKGPVAEWLGPELLRLHALVQS